MSVAASQSRTVSSSEADASSFELCEKATELTEPSCPSSVCCSVPVATSQSRIVPSHNADASSLESGEKATDKVSLCPSTICYSVPPSSVCCSAPVAASQSRTVLSFDADANSLESGEKATELTVPLYSLSVCCSVPNRLASFKIAYESSSSRHFYSRFSLQNALSFSSL